jgi:hypothetical protein
VPLRIAAGKLEIGEHAICFRCMADAAPIECSISRQALQDLAGAYALPLETSDLAEQLSVSCFRKSRRSQIASIQEPVSKRMEN